MKFSPSYMLKFWLMFPGRVSVILFPEAGKVNVAINGAAFVILS